MFCVNCGTKLVEDAKFCAQCGTAVGAAAIPSPPSGGAAPPAPTNSSSQWVTLIKSGKAKLEEIPEEELTEDICLTAVNKDIDALENVPDALKTEALYLAALAKHGLKGAYKFQYFPEAMKTEAVCIAAVQTHGTAFKYVPEAVKTEAL